MSAEFFGLMIDGRLTNFEKKRIISIEPYENGTKIIMEASHLSEEPIIYFTPEDYENVMQAYLSR